MVNVNVKLILEIDVNQGIVFLLHLMKYIWPALCTDSRPMHLWVPEPMGPSALASPALKLPFKCIKMSLPVLPRKLNHNFLLRIILRAHRGIPSVGLRRGFRPDRSPALVDFREWGQAQQRGFQHLLFCLSAEVPAREPPQIMGPACIYYFIGDSGKHNFHTSIRTGLQSCGGSSSLHFVFICLALWVRLQVRLNTQLVPMR